MIVISCAVAKVTAIVYVTWSLHAEENEELLRSVMEDKSLYVSRVGAAVPRRAAADFALGVAGGRLPRRQVAARRKLSAAAAASHNSDCSDSTLRLGCGAFTNSDFKIYEYLRSKNFVWQVAHLYIEIYY